MNKDIKTERRDSRADETDPPLGGGNPDPPFAETELPTERVIVYGDASATYGSMIAPEVIRPHEGKLENALRPVKEEQKKKTVERERKTEKAAKEEKETTHGAKKHYG